ncbi:MAG: proprotein convertase P-domain-containing protein, partial [Bacteroidota bacterium]
ISRDQGYIYEWTIEFASNVYPNQETFTVPIAGIAISDNGLYDNYTPDLVDWTPQHAGPNTVRVVTTDDYGCTYDTAVVLNVLPPYDPACLNCGPILTNTTFDTSICAGESFQADLVPANLGDTIIRWQSVLDEPFGRTPYSSITRALENEINISGHLPANITDVTQDVLSVCVDLENNGDLSEITLQLIAPNGRVINLIQNVGGNGENLAQTCFTPTATNTIAAGTAPYTGDFVISGGDWTDFNGTAINGTWNLRAWDRAGNDVGNFLRWSIDLRYNPEITYSWAPADGTLSCTNCPNPTFTPTAAQTYTLTLSTATGCTDQATVMVDFNTLNINIADAITPPSCPGDSDARIDLTFPPGSPAVTFLWEDASTGDTLVGVPAGTYTVT